MCALQGEPALLEGVLLGEPVSYPINLGTPITLVSPSLPLTSSPPTTPNGCPLP